MHTNRTSFYTKPQADLIKLCTADVLSCSPSNIPGNLTEKDPLHRG